MKTALISLVVVVLFYALMDWAASRFERDRSPK